MMESSTTTILRPVINQLPITKLDDFACRQLDKVRAIFIVNEHSLNYLIYPCI